MPEPESATPEEIRQFVDEGNLHSLVKTNPSVEDVQALLDKFPNKAEEKDNTGQWLPLHIAALYHSSVNVINLLLKKNKSAAEKKDKKGNLPLHIALYEGCKIDADVVKAVIDAYPDGAKQKDEEGRLPLHLAVQKNCGHDAVMALLDAYPEGVNERYEGGNLPLHTAISNKCKLDVVKTLLDAYPDGARTIDNEGCLPLYYALKDECGFDVVEAVIDAYPDGVKANDGLLLHVALHCKCEFDVVEALLGAYPEGVKKKTNEGSLPLHSAMIGKCGPNVVKAVLDLYPEGSKAKDGDGNLPLHLALSNKYGLDVVKALLDAFPEGAKERERGLFLPGRLPLHVALEEGCGVDVVKALLDMYTDSAIAEDCIEILRVALKMKCDIDVLMAVIAAYPDESKRLPLYYAMKEKCDVDIVKALIVTYPEGAKAMDETGRLLLHIALYSKCEFDVIKALLDAYPDGAKKKTDKGNLPLHFAMFSRCGLEVVIAVFHAFPGGAKEANEDGELPLHLALYKKCGIDVVKTLLDAYPDGAKVKDNEGQLPLHIALWKKCGFDVVKELLRAYRDGAKVKDNEGQLPLHIALEYQCASNAVRLLLGAYRDGVKTTNKHVKLPLHIALEYKCERDVVTAVYDANPEGLKATDNEGKLPLHYAFQNDADIHVTWDILNKHLGGVSSKDNYGNLPLHIAAQYNCKFDLMERLLLYHPDGAKELNNEGKLPLRIAIEHERETRVVNKLLKAYPDGVETLGKLGKQLFRNAIDKNYPADVIFALLQADMPVDNDGNFIEHDDSWNVCVAAEEDSAVGAVRRILSKDGGNFGRYIHVLTDVRDARGRQALGMASFKSLSAINQYLLFCGRYKLKIGPPEHLTLTSIVLRAKDHSERSDYGNVFDEVDNDRSGVMNRQELQAIATSLGLSPKLFLKGSGVGGCIKKDDFVSICKQQLGDGPRDVVIKLMRSKEHWQRECNAREAYDLNSEYVVLALPNIPTVDDFEEAVEEKKGGMDTIMEKYLEDIEIGKYAIVMDAADRNLLQIFYQEQPKIGATREILKQVFEAVKHLHEKKLMHGDLKMLNIVRMRVDNRLRLIDFDASAEIPPKGVESFAGAKFSSAILPPEMIAKLDTEEVDKFNEYWNCGDDIDMKEKVAPKKFMKEGIEIGQYVVKSFRTERGIPVFEGLPYDLVDASENIDAWSLGVLAFTLLTGEALIPSTRDDDCSSGADMHFLYTWGERPEILTERFKKIRDDSARDLVQQLLKREPEDRPSVESLLEKHAFFHPDNKVMESEMKERLKRIEDAQQMQIEALKEQARQMERMAANIALIKKLGYESKAELLRTRHILVNCMIEATGTIMPTCFRVYQNKLPELSEESKKKLLDFITELDGSGMSFEAKYAKLNLSEVGEDITLAGELKEYQEQVENGIKWAKRIKDIASKIVGGDTEAAFETIKSSIEDLIVGDKMYLYLIDELTGQPVQAPGWPIEITKPSDVVPKLLPVMVNTMRAMSVLNGAAGLVKMCGFPAPKVPKSWSKGLKESVESLKQESSVAEFGVVNEEVRDGTEESTTVRGASLREFMDFLQKYDPGLKEKKNGDFAGLQRIGDPEDGTALWTTLTDPKDIEDALNKRARCRQEEERQQQSGNDHNRVMAEAASENKERSITASTRERESEEGRKKNVLDTFGGISQSIISNAEIMELIQAAKDATASANKASKAAEEAASAAAANSCCSIT